MQVKMLHAQSLDLFGGLPGIRDRNLLDSAVNRPLNKWNYDQSTNLFVLAAAYGFGIAKNHAFNDGNKRTALLSIRAFLFVNGFTFNPAEVETVTTIEGLASSKVDEGLLAEWIEANSMKRSR
jgi:death-on-curing protein